MDQQLLGPEIENDRFSYWTLVLDTKWFTVKMKTFPVESLSDGRSLLAAKPLRIIYDIKCRCINREHGGALIVAEEPTQLKPSF